METARLAADAAADVHARHFGASHHATTTSKGRSDFVSAVDLEAQDVIAGLIAERHPRHAILSEEEGLGHGSADVPGPLWVVDPLDGTTNFLHGHPYFASSVAVAEGGRIRAGAVTASATGERWWAWDGGGSWYQRGTEPPVRSRTSEGRDFGSGLIGTGFPFKAIDALPAYLEQFDRVLRASAGIRRGGAAALDLCYLASGRLDAFWELHLAPWDIAAGLVILQEAGGQASRPNGDSLTLEAGAVVAANGPEFLKRLRAVLVSADTWPPEDSLWSSL